jgi:transcription elongation GreA/GreB family factor
MSKVFLAEQDDVSLPSPRLRPSSSYPNDVTLAGLAKIEVQLAAARKAYAQAQILADRHLIAAAAQQLHYWTEKRATANVVKPLSNKNEVRFGASVTIIRKDGREQTFQIVGEDEADPANGSISHISPLARSMFGKNVGDVVRAGHNEAKIKRIN